VQNWQVVGLGIIYTWGYLVGVVVSDVLGQARGTGVMQHATELGVGINDGWISEFSDSGAGSPG
jgi:hypothetical protein